MRKSNNEKLADKVIALFADGRIDKSDWRLWIPFYIKDQPEVIKVNAKNFADGIKDYIESVEPREPKIIDLDKYDRAGE